MIKLFWSSRHSDSSVRPLHVKGSKSCFDKLCCSSALSLRWQKQSERYKYLSAFCLSWFFEKLLFLFFCIIFSRLSNLFNSKRIETLFLRWLCKQRVFLSMKRGVKCHPIRHLMRIEREQSPQRQQQQLFVQYKYLELKWKKWDPKSYIGNYKIGKIIYSFHNFIQFSLYNLFAITNMAENAWNRKYTPNIGQIAMKYSQV